MVVLSCALPCRATSRMNSMQRSPRSGLNARTHKPRFGSLLAVALCETLLSALLLYTRVPKINLLENNGLLSPNIWMLVKTLGSLSETNPFLVCLNEPTRQWAQKSPSKFCVATAGSDHVPAAGFAKSWKRLGNFERQDEVRRWIELPVAATLCRAGKPQENIRFYDEDLPLMPCSAAA